MNNARVFYYSLFIQIFMYPPTPYDIYFRFCGFPVRIHPLFWVVAVLLGIGSPIDRLPLWLLDLAIWVAAVFVSILLHEIGHAAVFRYVLRVPSKIVLCFGGVTIPSYPHQRQYNWLGFFKEVFLFAAGPFTGFVLAGLIILFLWVFPISDDAAAGLSGFHPKAIVLTFLQDLFWVCVVWGVFNLFPIYPMDGGQIAREVFCFLLPRNGVRYSLVLSIAVCIFLFAVSLKFGSIYMAMFMGYFAYQNYQELIFRSFRRR